MVMLAVAVATIAATAVIALVRAARHVAAKRRAGTAADRRPAGRPCGRPSRCLPRYLRAAEGAADDRAGALATVRRHRATRAAADGATDHRAVLPPSAPPTAAPATRRARRQARCSCHLPWPAVQSRRSKRRRRERGDFFHIPYSSLFAIWLLKVRSVRRSESIDVVSGIVPNRGPIHFNELAAKNSTGPHPCRGHSGNKLFTNQRVRTAAPECPQTHASIGFAEGPALWNDRPPKHGVARLRHTWQHIGNGSWAAPETAVGKK